MRKKVFTASFMFFFLLFASLGSAQNPFITKPEKQFEVPAPSIKNSLFSKILIWQQQLREKMSDLVHQAKDSRDIRPLLLLVMTAFVYGAVHAAGPGHGKAIAFSYILSQRPTRLQALLFSNTLAMIHGLSGILFVLVVRVLLRLGVTKNLETVTYVTQLVSFGLITCLGLWIFVKSLITVKTRKRDLGHDATRFVRDKQYAGPILSASAIGVIPCPGVVMVMLFALSMELIVLGVVLAIAISIGMAMTVSAVVLMAMSGKAVSLLVASKDAKRLISVEFFIETVAGLALTVLGLLLFLANL
jgi:nickel/cobalt transporter (NicO) family protein